MIRSRFNMAAAVWSKPVRCSFRSVAGKSAGAGTMLLECEVGRAAADGEQVQMFGRQGPIVIVAMPGIAGPSQSRPKAGRRGGPRQPKPPGVGESGIGQQVGSLGREGLQGDPQDGRQTHQRRVAIEGRESLSSRHDALTPSSDAKQSSDGRLTFQDHPSAPVSHVRSPAAELQSVTHPLLGVKKDSFSVERRSVPKRLREMTPLGIPLLEARRCIFQPSVH